MRSSPEFEAEVALAKALDAGRYKAADQALLRGATLVGIGAQEQLDLWSLALKHGPRHLDWMRERAGPPQAEQVWPTLLGRSWLAVRPAIADRLLEWGTSPNAWTEGDATPFAYALRSPSAAVFDWAMAHTDRSLGQSNLGTPHSLFRLLFFRHYPLKRNVVLEGVVFPTAERLEAVLAARLPTLEDPFQVLVGRTHPQPDEFLGAWCALLNAGYRPEGPSRLFQPESPSVLEAARNHAQFGTAFRHWETAGLRQEALSQRTTITGPRRRVRS